MKQKIKIILENGQFKEGCGTPPGGRFISVGFAAAHYGSRSPCTSNEEVNSSIKHCKKWIEEEGDIFAGIEDLTTRPEEIDNSISHTSMEEQEGTSDQHSNPPCFVNNDDFTLERWMK